MYETLFRLKKSSVGDISRFFRMSCSPHRQKGHVPLRVSMDENMGDKKSQALNTSKNSQFEYRNPKEIRMTEIQMTKTSAEGWLVPRFEN